MKIAPREIETFLKTPGKNVGVVLFYGPDTGLSKERAKTAGRTITPDLNDPFNAITLQGEDIAADPAILTDEASAISMMGGMRLIRIQGGSDKITTALKGYLENPNDQSFITIEASELTPRSSLRKLCESNTKAAAIASYIEDARDLNRLIRDTMAEENIRIEQDAINWLSHHIQGNREKARSELEKLILYKGKNDPSPITLKEAQEICGDSGVATLDELIFATAGGQANIALQSYHTLLQEGVNFIVIVRSLQNHFKRLHQAKINMDQGMNAQEAMKKLSPPIFFKNQTPFQNQLRRWSSSKILAILSKLIDLEANCKKTGAAVDTLCAQTILSISKARG